MAQPEVRFGAAFAGGVSEGTELGGIPEFAQRAEALGFEYLAAGEHVMDGNPPRPTLLAIPTLAAAAGATRRIRLLTGVVLAPLYHPVILAKLAGSLDVVSRGRLVFGVGLGGQREGDYEAVGIPTRERGRRADEALALIKRLWTEEHVSFQGRFYQCQDVTLLPPPVQRPHPPIWVAGRAEGAMRRAALLGDGWYPYLYDVERYRASVAKVREFAAEAGRSLEGFQWGLLQPLCIAEREEDALRVAVATLGQRYRSARRPPEEVVRDYCVLGSPQGVIREVERRIEAGARHIVFNWVGTDDRAGWEQMETVGKHVLPYFRG